MSREGRRRLAGVEQGRRPVADDGGAAPVVRGRGERVWELHYGKRNLAVGSIWGEEGRRRGLRVELEETALMAAAVSSGGRARGSKAPFIGGSR